MSMIQDYRFNPKNGIEFGLYSLGDRMPDPLTNEFVSEKQRIDELVETATFAEEAGLDFFGLGESHQEYFVSQAHAVILGAIANATNRIKIGSDATILSTSDPVRVFENFATLDLLSNGRAELVAGRASRLGLFKLLGYDVEDYGDLFEEKFKLLLKIANNEKVTWSGKFRPPLDNAEIFPRPLNGKMPIWRAVGGPAQSAIKAGKAGVPMTLAMLAGPVSRFKETIYYYRQSLRLNGYDPADFPITTGGVFYTAKDMSTALREYYPRLNVGMTRANGYGFNKRLFAMQRDPLEVMAIGNPDEIVEKLLYQYEQFGMQRYIAHIDFGGVPHKKVMEEIETIGTKILPKLRKYTQTYESEAFQKGGMKE
ncbi:LLM class flavin-dependent oxidoreductase [Lactobacillus alvi]|uniref:LLM class flavin-dependent oxidoreductase n=1 Tax=Limosilactobacillus alvi TaxID=990412 RepID=A0ABS2EQF1_9LACO|nr:LLM class flavin-dependent oxidoreductase [Limosilactobacillus alvi]MBM6754733.1 LLM class flavin-dependent oxidoreductase [Limosilactobacillus alvi]